jgi:hypothetical protein
MYEGFLLDKKAKWLLKLFFYFDIFESNQIKGIV